jgi:hypothetical protein
MKIKARNVHRSPYIKVYIHICILKRQRVVKALCIHFSEKLKMGVVHFERLYLENHWSDRVQTLPVGRGPLPTHRTF